MNPHSATEGGWLASAHTHALSQAASQGYGEDKMEEKEQCKNFPPCWKVHFSQVGLRTPLSVRRESRAYKVPLHIPTLPLKLCG